MDNYIIDEKKYQVQVFLGLGSNIGEPKENIFKAFEEIKNNVLKKAEISSIYVTEPQDVKEQPDFLNAVCKGYFNGSPFSLLKKIAKIEESLGRNRKIEQRRGKRSMDIDILLFGNEKINYGNEIDGEGNWLIIPHNRLNIRRFAIEPLLELDATLKDPLSGQPFSEIIKTVLDQGIYRL